MTIDTERPDGLRARKRAATRSSIEHAAVALGLELGYENVTVEMICDATGVSPRTFFNYFGVKEHAFLGAAPAPLTESATLRFIEGGGEDVVGELAALIAAPFLDIPQDAALLRSRFRLVTRTPELLGRQLEWMTAQERNLADLVVDRFRAAGRPTDGLRDEAEMVVALAYTVIRFALQRTYAEFSENSDVSLWLARARELLRVAAGRS
ncbi:AcrR family transcriptional regulator [Mycetocola sp. CAN_C7]|uniref:TetR/AcrR family transcriptional regulator n=1 Tax=Mycetocola sp. CAN_C7 TaxID=2787724 RepID=UPI0018C9C443